MVNIENILVAADLSPHSSSVINRGFVLAKTQPKSRLTIFHATGIDAINVLRDFLGEKQDSVKNKILQDAHDQLAALVAAVPANQDGITVELKVDQGFASAAVPRAVENSAIDLVVLGAHGSGFIQRVLLGSTASRLLRKSTCPVLVVKREAYRSYQRVLIAVDFSPCSEKVLRFAHAIAPHADFVLCHVCDVPFHEKMEYAGVSEDLILHYQVEARKRAMQQLRELAHTAGLAVSDYSIAILYGDASRTILDHEEKYGFDLVVMGKHGSHITEELLLGSVTKRVLASSQADMLVVVDHRYPELLVQTD